MNFRLPPAHPNADQTSRIKELRWAISTFGVAGIVILAVSIAMSQQMPQPNAGLPGPGRTSDGFAALPETANPRPDSNRLLEDSMRQRDVMKRIRELNELRQKEMTSDTAKLLSIVHALQTEMDNKQDDTLKVDELRKVEEIAKLAHGVQEKMKATVGD